MKEKFQVGEKVFWFTGREYLAGVVIDHKYGNEYGIMLEREKMPILAFSHELRRADSND